MKFKMPRNSMFAVLMRSPWWVSAAVAVLLSVGAAAVLPKDLASLGVFVSVPFVVIALLAAIKQFRQPSSARVEAITMAVAGMSWAEFAPLLEAGFVRDGCAVQRLNQTAADFFLDRKGQAAVVSAKRWKAARIGVDALRELQTAREKRAAREAIFIGLGEVSESALAYAREHDIALMSAPELAKLLRHQKI